MDPLPPLNALRAFEAAARHLSITVAADELHVTPGAVSRQIRMLEDLLRVQLLHRGHRQITLTRQGEDYYRAVTKAIDSLREATVRLTRRSRRKQLKVRAYTTFAMRWLIPRLSSFHTANPGIEVLLTASLDEVDFRKEDIDGAIRLGDGKWSGVNTYRLVPNVLVPVCSPAVLAGRPKVRKPADLQHQTLLHSIARPDDWGHWLEATRADGQVDARSGMTYQSSAMAYAAAIEGQGFAIAQRFLVEADLASGKLVAPFKQTVDMGDFTYYLLTPSDRKESASMTTFRQWLLAQFAEP
ncbi:transcriptional regulator GcvA [Variovorax sp. Sphag1AA]|uniref:transcriptional regulator GcvA n=1 Tax=Variovorax sp. Sphag1AA TaxID=2587027 RepID=UPI001617C434|nr:transcriptional regulator GcvA [Variovorax sp. Sphag1AA]MBB3178145.1 LysR family glycine cleavage system transcriptional activator [Variovorax sp. Sphag1AA]